MTDRYTTLVSTPWGRKTARALGLPQPEPLRRWTPGQDLLPRPQLLLLGPEGASPWSDRLLAAGLEVHRTRQEGTSYGAVVVDLTTATTPADLQDPALATGSALKSLSRNGRVVVLCRAPQPQDPEQAATQEGAVGFMRSLAHEMRGGATCNAVVLEEEAEPAGEAAWGVLRFLLSARSAYVSGQPVHVGAADAAGAERMLPADPDRPLEGRVAVVTGAARGIGAEIARTLHQDGARLVLVDVAPAGEALAQMANEVSGVALQLDITEPDAGSRLAQCAVQHFGSLDVVVHNAGVTRDRMLAGMDEGRWSQVLRINLEAQLRMNRQLLEGDLLGARPHVVCLASTSGIAGNRGQTNYAASKAGIIGMVHALSEELRARGGTINAVAPGFIETDMTHAMPAATREVARRLNSMQQGGHPGDVAQAVSFLASEAAAGVNGQTLRVCGQSMVGA